MRLKQIFPIFLSLILFGMLIFKINNDEKIVVSSDIQSTGVTLLTTTTTIPPSTTVLTVPRTIPPRPITTIHVSRDRSPVNWYAVADCESGARDRYRRIIPGSANWSINTGNGYFGGLQFSHSTWISNGGGQFAPNAHLTSAENQVTVASSMSLSHWPICKKYG